MKLGILGFILLFNTIAFAQNSEELRYRKLFERQELLHRSYRDRYIDLTDINKQDSLRSWYRLLLQTPANIQSLNVASARTADVILGKDYRLLFIYYSVTGQLIQAGQTFGLYLISSHTLIDNFINDPQSRTKNLELIDVMKENFAPLQTTEIRKIEDCFVKTLEGLNVVRQFDIGNFDKTTTALRECSTKSTLVADLNEKLVHLFKTEKYAGAPFPVSFTGFIGGNTVDLHTDVPREPADILNLGQQLNLITTAKAPNSEKLYSKLSIADYQEMMPTPEAALNLFSTEEGFQNTLGIPLTESPHNTFGLSDSNHLGIYGEVIQSIRDAKESVFIDLFWMGGSIGMNLAKELFQKVIDDPEFTVVIISDRENKFQYGLELDMIYNYMRAFSEKFTDKNFYIAPANINLKRTALPEFIDLLVTNNVVNSLHSQDNIKELLKKDGFNLLAKSDHTKVIVTDGKNPETGVAYVGSKNWTDSSGGINYDEVAAVRGPATALILNSFYYDVLEAFDLDLDNRLGGNMVKNHIAAKFSKGISKRKAAEALIAEIDVLNRYSGISYAVPYIERGNASVAPAQNNIYGTEMSAVEQNIQVILNAKKQVIVDDQFLYDPRIISALKVAKQVNNVEVYVMMESLLYYSQEGLSGSHIPNILYVPELTSIGIQVKWQVTPQAVVDAILADNAKHPAQMVTATFHLKALTVDGVLAKDAGNCAGDTGPTAGGGTVPVLITGSANKDAMTMTGGFREYQVAVYDNDVVARHDCVFWSRWNSDDSTRSTDGTDFDLPQQAQQMGITDKAAFLNLLKQVFFTPYNFTKDFF